MLRRISPDLVYVTLWLSGAYSLLLWPPILRATEFIAEPLRRAAGLENLPWMIKGIVLFLAVDMAAYATHRAMHSIPFLWRFHQIHHSATDLRPVIAFRFHVVEVAARMFASMLPLALLGVNAADAPLTMLFIPLVVEILAHSDLAWSLGPLGRLVVSPRFHRVHHVAGAAQANANYGLVMTIWDDLFGTSVREDTSDLPRGSTDVAIDESFVAHLVHPFRGRHDASV
jgi:sterol desaturase/sphingolipid hydroxylase (fatty acid hydroxylase superfamily)